MSNQGATVSAIVLAGGRAQRFGGDKLRALLRDGRTARQTRSIRSGSSVVSPRPTGWMPVRPWSRARVR